MGKREDRLRRQFEAIERRAPVGGPALRALRREHYRALRLPLAVLLVIGGLFGFLPILGFWMVPLGLIILSVDIPVVRRWRRQATVSLGLWLKTRYPALAGKLGFDNENHRPREADAGADGVR